MSTALPISTIVVAMDLHDDLGDAVLITGTALSERLGAKLHVVDIWPQLEAGGFPYSKMGEAAELDQYEAKRSERKAEFEARVLPIAPDAIRSALIGDTADTIAEYLSSENADLLVIGSHQKGFWERLWQGSVSDDTIHEAPCAVFVVTAPFAKGVH